MGIAAGIIPEGASSRGQSLSHGYAVTAPVVPKAWPPPTKRRWRLGRRSRCPKFFARMCSQNFDRCLSFLLAFSATGGARKRPPLHKGAFGDGGCGLPRRPVGPPRNDKRSLSFRGAERRGNPPFLRWTMDGGSGRRVVGPCGRSTEVPAMGRCRHRPLRKAQSTTQASRRAVKRPRPRGRGMGGNRRKDHPKRGTAAATAAAALSEAESAERAAGQIQPLPDTLRVQHGVLGSEVSAKPRPCSRRSCVN